MPVTDLAERPDLSRVRARRPLPAGIRSGLRVRRAGLGPDADRSTAHRPPSWPAHRRLRLRIPRVAGRDVPGGGVRGCGHRAGPSGRRSTRRQRGAGGHCGDGQPARGHADGQALRRRHRRLVRQGAGARPGGRRHPPRRVRRNIADTAASMAVVGDDPAAKSSTLPSSSDATLVDLHMPIMFPGDVQEALDLSRHAVALSRASGIWVGMKVVTPSQTARARSTCIRIASDPVMPTMEFDGKLFVPRPSGRLLTPYTLEMEREFQQVRSELARRYGVANGLEPSDGARPRRLDRHRRQRAHVPRAARGARAARSPGRRRAALRSASACSISSCPCPSTMDRCASSPTGWPRCSSSRRRTRRSNCS